MAARDGQSGTRVIPAALVFVFACTAGGTSGEAEWALGDKADSLCDDSGDLCWPTRDIQAMREVFLLEEELALGRGDPLAAVNGILDLVEGDLAHKLTPEELAAATELRARIGALGEQYPAAEADQIATELQERVLKRLSGAYYAAFMVPTGRSAVLEKEGKEDEAAGDAEGQGETTQGLTAGMRESLDMLRGSGALGRAYASMLELSGVLELDYEVINAKNFGEWDAENERIVPRGLSRHERVRQIIADYKRASAFVGAVSGAEGLIPIAGVGISIAHETYALFRLHARMTFEIAAVHGWNIREGRNLFYVTMMLLTEGLLAETGDILVSNALVPYLARKLAKRLGLELPEQLAKRLASRSVGNLLALFSKKSQQKIAQTAITKGLKGFGKQILGYATLGLTIIASSAIDYVVTERMGWHIDLVARRWMQDLMMEGSTYLSEPEPRDCFFRSLGALAWADGDVSDRERRLVQAFLAKPYYLDESAWFFLESPERIRQSEAVRTIGSAADPGGQARSCVEDSFEGGLAQHKISLLGHLYAMMEVDLVETPAERELYESLVGELEGGFLDGPSIDGSHLGYVERAIYITLQPSSMDVPEEYAEAVSSMLPEDTLDFLAEPKPDVARDFRCGFDGLCD